MAQQSVVQSMAQQSVVQSMAQQSVVQSMAQQSVVQSMVLYVWDLLHGLSAKVPSSPTRTSIKPQSKPHTCPEKRSVGPQALIELMQSTMHVAMLGHHEPL